jgi:hypothetical protein
MPVAGSAEPMERDPIMLLVVLGLTVALYVARWLITSSLVERVSFAFG